jgi:hypothetical protein
MKLLLAATLSVAFLAGCSSIAPPEVAPTKVAKSEERVKIVLPRKGASESAGRQPGDYVVFRFSGSYRKAPVELLQRVVSRRDNVLVVDVSVDGHPTLRLDIDDRKESRGTILAVARLTDRGAEPAEDDAYEALLADLILLADDNEGLIDDEEVELDLGASSLSATKRTYRVSLGGRPAFMSTLSSETFAWGDAGGEIRTTAGDIVYRAEVIEMGRQRSAALATSEAEDALEGLDHLDR